MGGRVFWNLDQIFQGFMGSKNVFSDAEVLEIGQNYVLGVKYLTNVCDMYVMTYVVYAGRTDRYVTVKINQIQDLN